MCVNMHMYKCVSMCVNKCVGISMCKYCVSVCISM